MDSKIFKELFPQELPEQPVSAFDRFERGLHDGLLGLNKGIPTGIAKLDKVLQNLNRGIYYTIFSEGGTGKSSLIWNILINVIDYCIENKLKIKVFLFSMEVEASRVIAKMTCYKIFKAKRILMDPDYLLSRGENKPASEAIKLALSYRKYFDYLLSSGILELYDMPMSPHEIKLKVDKYAAANGTFDPATGKYISKDRNEYVFIVTDTVGNLSDNGMSAKQKIDCHSAFCRSDYRDRYNYIPINISHANRAISDPVRAKMGEVFPMLSDIKETNMLEQDSSVVICLFNPAKHIMIFKQQLENFMGYNIPMLGNRFRSIGVLKNRHGEDNVRIGLSYYGECGAFESISASSEMETKEYYSIINVKSNADNFKK